jgi:hypothetical protein
MKPFSESQLAKLREMRPVIDEAFQSIVKSLISADLLETENIDEIIEDWNEVIDFYVREYQERK